ncbi:MAG: response regulator transcription factor [Beijerinckiaceae bacterium]
MAHPRIAVVDDQEAVRTALGDMLGVYGYKVDLYDSADAFLASGQAEDTACVIADVRMPGTDGIGLVRELGQRGVDSPVVLISGHADVPMAVAGLKAGAQDFIEKPVDDVRLVAAINRSLAARFERQAGKQANKEAETRFERLTPREMEVFDLVAEGMTSQAIATRLGISSRTVESYRAQLMEKLQLDSVAAIVRLAVRLGRVSA